MVRLQVRARTREQFHELRKLVGRERVYQQGTDVHYYVDLRDRSEADLVMVNLEAVGIRSRIMPE